jgi:hypothetical protein
VADGEGLTGAVGDALATAEEDDPLPKIGAEEEADEDSTRGRL